MMQTLIKGEIKGGRCLKHDIYYLYLGQQSWSTNYLDLRLPSFSAACTHLEFCQVLSDGLLMGYMYLSAKCLCCNMCSLPQPKQSRPDRAWNLYYA